ncbi:MAG TPA: hypothetical protein VK808_11065 [Bacteroidia bacterium]|nr:hypothetical protein [Bacteroidia bacterium]
MTDYNKMAPGSRVWIFQADRELTPVESKAISNELLKFVESWLSHGSLLKAHYKLLHYRFIIFIADEEGDNMCGRAIDASVRFVKELEKKYNLSLLNRSRVAYIKDGRVQACTLDELGQRIEDGEITPDTDVFNNLVSTKEEFDHSWTVPLSKSWHRSYIMQNQ